MIKNIIFDIGNVLLEFSPEKILSEIQKEKREKLFQIIFNSEEWVMLDKGSINEKDAFENMCIKNPELRDDILRIADTWIDTLIPIKTNTEALIELKKSGFNIFLLSNFHKKAFSEVYSKYDFFSYCDGKIISYEHNLVKPSLEIYLLLIKKYGIIPQETLFIDDTQKNVESALKINIKGLLYRKGCDIIEEVYKIRKR